MSKCHLEQHGPSSHDDRLPQMLRTEGICARAPERSRQLWQTSVLVHSSAAAFAEVNDGIVDGCVLISRYMCCQVVWGWCIKLLLSN
jgi:hypothetical protein